MPRIFNGTMATDITQETTTFCICWELTLSDSSVERFTNHDQDLTFLGETFESNSGFDSSMLESMEGIQPDNAEMRVLFTTGGVSLTDVRRGKYNDARVKVYMVNWTDTTSYCALPGGYLHKIKTSDNNSATFELVSLRSKLETPTGRVVLPTCDARLGDSRCGVSLGSYTHTGTVTGVTSTIQFSASVAASPAPSDGLYDYGRLTWTSGNNNGDVVEVKRFASGAFTLVLPSVETMQVGDTFSVSYGCDLRPDTCKNTFNNFVNFRGFPHVPGNFKAMKRAQ